MTNIPTITYVLDTMGVTGAIVGGYVASRSRYSQDKSKDAVILIGLQEKRIKILEDTNKELENKLSLLNDSINQMNGELASYRKLKTVDPSILINLTSTLNALLETLTKDGIHIATQKVDTQVIKESR